MVVAMVTERATPKTATEEGDVGASDDGEELFCASDPLLIICGVVERTFSICCVGEFAAEEEESPDKVEMPEMRDMGRLAPLTTRGFDVSSRGRGRPCAL